MILGVDVSAWNSLQTPWAKLKQAGVEFAIVKGCQATATANHMALARDAGMIVGEYYWHDPTIAAARQAAEIIEDCAENKPAFVWLDVEQWWSNWGLWADWQYYHKITQAQVPKISPSVISENAHNVMGILSEALEVPVGMYSARWFIDGYAPGIATWATGYPLWIMTIISEPIHEATWAEISAGPSGTYKPNLPTKMVSWLLAQWSSAKIMPGTSDRIDLNMFPGTLACFRDWAGLTPPGPSLEERVGALEAWVKAHG